MSDRPQPFSQMFDLATLGEAERVIKLAPSQRERDTIAEWAEIEALDTFAASVRLKRASGDLYDYEASFAADITQSCVVTLEPVHAHLEGSVARRFRLIASRGRRRLADDESMDTVEDDETETVTSGAIDLAAPALEEFVLGIDPYPRAPGAQFEPPADPAKPAHPFAALKTLKKER